MFEEKHISLLLLPPSLFFLPADLHSRWVGLSVRSFVLSFFLFLFRLFVFPSAARVSPCFPVPLLQRETTERRIQPRTRRRCVPFLRAHRHEKLRGAPSDSQEPGKRSASIKHSPPPPPPPSPSHPLPVHSSCLSRSVIEQRLLARLYRATKLHNDNDGEIKAIKFVYVRAVCRRARPKGPAGGRAAGRISARRH